MTRWPSPRQVALEVGGQILVAGKTGFDLAALETDGLHLIRSCLASRIRRQSLSQVVRTGWQVLVMVAEREVPEQAVGDWFFLVAVFAVSGVLVVVWLGGWLAAALTGHALGVGYAQALGVLVRLVGSLSDPARTFLRRLAISLAQQSLFIPAIPQPLLIHDRPAGLGVRYC